MLIRVGFEIGISCSQPTPMTILLSIHPDRRHDIVGETGPRPVFRAAQDLAAMTGATRLACRSSAPDRVAGLAIRHDRRTILLVANLTPTEQLATIGGSGPVRLGPYATRKLAL